MLDFSGNNTFSSGLALSGTGGIAAQANMVSTPLGSGGITLNNGAYLQVSTLAAATVGSLSTLSSAGYTPGGLTARYYSFGTAPTLQAVASSGIVPGAVIGGVPSSDTTIVNHPVNIMGNNVASSPQDIEVYGGLIDISSAGLYSFEQRNDDEAQIVIDGAAVGNNAGGLGNAGTIAGVYLTAGFHQITVRHQNGGGGSGIQLMYTGPDTLAAGVPGSGWENIPTSALYYSTALTGSAGGNGYLNAAQINNAVSVSTTAAATIDAGGSEFNSTFAGLTLNPSSTLTVNNQEGSGYIGVMGLTVVGSGATVNPNSGMLYLIGGVNDFNGTVGNGLTKIGQGTLILGGSGGAPGGTFTGPLAINGGYVQVASPYALTSGTTTVGLVSGGSATMATLDLNGTQNVAGNILLNASGPATADTLYPAALYNSNPAQASIASGSLVLIGTAVGGKNPSIGGYGDIAISGNIVDGPAAGQPWTKTGPDTLILGGSNTFTGNLTVSVGVLAIGSSNAFGSTTAGTVSIATGTTMDLAGQSITATARTLNLVGTGLTGYAMNNTLGALINSVGGTTSTYSGLINLSGGVGVGSNSYLASSPGGNIVLSGTIGPAAAGDGINKVGADTLTITGSVITTTGGYNLQEGTTVLSGSGVLSGGAPINLIAGATLQLNNSATNFNNRLGGAGNSETFDGNVLIIGNSADTSELLSGGTIKFTNSAPVITLQPTGTGSLLLNITNNGALGYTAGATALFRGNGLGTVALTATATSPGIAMFGDGTQTNPGFVGSAGTTGTAQGVLPWALVDTSGTGNGMSLATYNTANGFQALNFANSTGVTNALTTGLNVELTGGTATVSGNGIYSLNSLTLVGSSGGGNPTINAGSTLQLQSGGLLALAGTSTISGAGALSTAANAPLIIHTPNPDTGSSTTRLNVNVPILGTTGIVVKADNGLAVFNAPQIYAGTTVINGGTLQLAAGNQTLYAQPTTGNSPGNYNAVLTPSNVISAIVNLGGTLDLNGNAQTVTNLTNNGVNQAAMNAAEQPFSGGTITNSSTATATLSILQAGNNVYWGGNITGNVNLITAGGWIYNIESPNSYTGTTTKQGGNLTLIDLGQLTNTSAIYLNGGNLWWNDTGTQAGIQRLPTTASINMNGGGFAYSARSGTQGAITVGNLNLLSGASLIEPAPNNGGASITFTNTSSTLTRNVGATISVTTYSTTSANLGLGDAAHVYFTVPLATTGGSAGGLVGAWFTANAMDPATGVVDAGFATYTASGGIGNINPNLVTIATGNVPSGVNARMNGNVTLPAGGATLNTLSMITNTAMTLTFAASTDQLVVTGGGILGGLQNQTRTIGSAANSGQITAGPGQPELFIYNGNNTLTVNSTIVDNSVSGGLNVVIGNMSQGATAGAVTLAGTNSYMGTTYINGPVNLNATGAPAIPGSLVAMSTVVSAASDGDNYNITFNQSNQISSTGSVTLNGGTILNLNSFNNTIANLTLNNFSGEQNYAAATVLTGAGMLTVTGSVSVGNNTDTFLVPTLNGELTLSNTSPTISAAPNAVAPLQIGLQLNSAVTLTAPTSTPLVISGSGIVGIGGQSQYANPTYVTAGTTLALGSTANVTEIGNSQVQLAAGATLDARGLSGTIGSLAGSGTLMNFNATTAGTVVTGMDNTNSTFFGVLANAYATGLLNVTKIGAGNFNLSANNLGTGLNSPNLGTLTVSGGSVTLNTTAAAVGFSAYTLNAGGTLTVDDSVNVLNNRLGGSFELVSPSVATSTTTARTLTFQGGNLNVYGNSSGTVSENLGNLTPGNGGGSVITVSAAGTGGVNMSINSFVAQNGYATLLIRGDNLSSAGTATAANTATIVLPTLANYSTPSVASAMSYDNNGNNPPATTPLTQGAGNDATPTMSIRPDILVDTSATGSGISFAVRDTSTGAIRPLAASEYVTSVGSLTNNAGNLFSVNYVTNVAVSTAQTISNPLYLNSLTLASSGSITSAAAASQSVNSLLFLNSGGVLATGGTTSINTGLITTGGVSTDVHVVGASTALNMNSSFVTTTSGLVKADGGTLVFNSPQYYTGAGHADQRRPAATQRRQQHHPRAAHRHGPRRAGLGRQRRHVGPRRQQPGGGCDLERQHPTRRRRHDHQLVDRGGEPHFQRRRRKHLRREHHQRRQRRPLVLQAGRRQLDVDRDQFLWRPHQRRRGHADPQGRRHVDQHRGGQRELRRADG